MPKKSKAKPINELMTVKEVADVLKCHHNTVRNYMRRGILTPIRYIKTPGAKIYFERSAIEKLLKGEK